MRHKRKTKRTYRKRNNRSSGKIKTALIVLFSLALVSLSVALVWHKKQAKNVVETQNTSNSSGFIEKEFVPATSFGTNIERKEYPRYITRELYSGAVLETREKVDNSYFEDVVFIGDSFVEGLNLYIYPCVPELGIVQISEDTLYNIKDSLISEKYSLDDEGEKDASSEDSELDTFIRKVKDSYPHAGKIYLALGTDFIDNPDFIQVYGDMILKVRQTYPNGVIYVQAIPPVGSGENSPKDEYSFLNNAIINQFNTELMDFCIEQGINYLDIPAGFTPSGELAESATVDGVHITGEHYFMWFNYIKRHTVS